ncbi:hypothetical protein QSJ19_22940 [Gordonia sp. ABSL11-1]|uniref:hypothetical protein n=1 Tax=Gordonia sp. ABSL11-1 TaxID=3053924 RepID=UPI002573B142|nr:hypothetical protein [Gordonia sp. ABSL11-1]MDL9948382.1 hypothetical protein [Gordonia sp. ABSL11-1]
MSVVERAERKAALLRRTANLVERLRAVETERDSLIEQRDGQCRELKAAGASIRELQETLGVSRSRVQQILRDEIP